MCLIHTSGLQQTGRQRSDIVPLSIAKAHVAHKGIQRQDAAHDARIVGEEE